jgi:ATP-binding cassette subfamily B protein
MKVRVTAAIFMLILAKVATVTVPLLYKVIVDGLAGTDSAQKEIVAESGLPEFVLLPIVLIVGFGVLRLLSQAFNELRDFFFARVGRRATRVVALRVFRFMHDLALRFHLDRQTGGLSRTIERGTRAIESLLRLSLFSILPTLVEAVLSSAILWIMFGFRFAAVTFVTIAVYIAYTMWVTEWRLKYRRQMNESDNEANTRAIDSLLNYETVKYFGNEDHESSRYDKSLRNYENASVRSITTLSLVNIGQGFIIGVGLVVVLLMAAQGIKDGTLTIGDFTAVYAYMIQLYLPLNFLGFVYREIKQSLVDMEYMFSLLGEEVEVGDKPNAPQLVANSGEVVFDDVEFGYDARRPILKGISFSVPAGKTTAIVGPTGAGKSTISRLLFRFYDVNDGRITIDGQDIRDVTQSSLRRAIGIVPQDTVLFNDTVLYNIGYGRPSATRDEIEDAARMAQIHDFIVSTPDGYDTVVGERGLKLSGGEKQRVAIARTILKDPKILMFDEATSALDTHTEKEIQAALKKISTDRTTLIIAHRLSTVVEADEILVFDGGMIIERGRHDDLLAKGGVYARLWERQQESEGAPGSPSRLHTVGAVAQ